MIDTALQRKNMVESQVRPSNVTDRRIMAAMSRLPRERFVGADNASLAYMDTALQLAPGRTLMTARDLAKLVQLADIAVGDRVLIVGSWLGYSAAVVAEMGGVVTALDESGETASAAQAILKDVGVSNVTTVAGPLAQGWAERAPFDVIVVEGCVESAPEQLLAQLRGGGRLVAIETDAGVMRAVRYQTLGEAPQRTMSRRVAFEASASPLPGFELPRRMFAF